MRQLIEKIVQFWAALPAPVTSILSHTVSICIGLLIAVSLHYLLYRLGLPSKPFIYVSF